MMSIDPWEKFPDMRPINRAPLLGTINGVGFSMYGARDRDEMTQTYVTTRCFCFVFIPLIPIGSYRVANAQGSGWYILGKEPMSVFARFWNMLLFSAILIGGGIGYWNSYINTPDYIAQKKLEQAEQEIIKEEWLTGWVLELADRHRKDAPQKVLKLFDTVLADAGSPSKKVTEIRVSLLELHAAEKSFQTAVESAQRHVYDDLNSGRGTDSFYSRYNSAPLSEQKRIVDGKADEARKEFADQGASIFLFDSAKDEEAGNKEAFHSLDEPTTFVTLHKPPVVEDWPRWRGPRGDGSWQAPKLAKSWPKDGLKSVWRRPIGAGYSGIAVVGNRVYAMDRPPKKDVENVHCFDAASGKLLWTHRYDAVYGKLSYGKGPRSTPTIHNTRVYTLGAVGHLHCLNAGDGKVIWSKDLKADYKAHQPEWGFSSSPVIHENKVIVHAGLKPNGCYAAFDLTTGKEIWRGGDDPTGYGTPIVIRQGDAELLVGWTPENIVGLTLDEGKVAWKIPYKVTYGVSIATPIFREQTVLVSGYWEGSKAIHLDDSLRKATLVWEENRYLRGLMAQPLYRGGHVYLLDKSQGLVCFELATNKVVWNDKNQMTPRGRNPQATIVWIGESDRALVLNSAGELLQVQLTPAGYKELSRAKVVGETWAHPAYAGRFLFARDDSEIVCVELP